MKCSLINQKGNFIVEFAIVGVFFALLLVFSADIVIKLAYKGKLDRMSYSAASIIKERTELVGSDQFDLIENPNGLGEANMLYSIVLSSLKRTSGNFDEKNFGFQLHIKRKGNNLSSEFTRTITRGVNCQSSAPSDNEGLDFITTFGRYATLYQVTLCYDTDNWFGHLVGEEFTRVSSRSVIMGR